MVSIVLIENNGTVKGLKTKELTPETLYKKCGFRVNEDFSIRYTWHVKMQDKVNANNTTYALSVWAKKTGKANTENKYDFPPPIDKDLFFGTCAVVRTNPADGSFLDLTTEMWLKAYESLFGGFEDLNGDEDELSEDELANVDPSLLTKNGYLKDGFVVSDKELNSSSPSIEEEDEEDEEEEEKVKPKKIVKKGVMKDVVKKASAENAKNALAVDVKPKKRIVKKTDEIKKPIEKKSIEKKPIEKKSTAKKSTAPVKVSAKPKPAPHKEDADADTDTENDTISELEEEVYTFSDEE